jgi:hypothetical protein
MAMEHMTVSSISIASSVVRTFYWCTEKILVHDICSWACWCRILAFAEISWSVFGLPVCRGYLSTCYPKKGGSLRRHFQNGITGFYLITLSRKQGLGHSMAKKKKIHHVTRGNHLVLRSTVTAYHVIMPLPLPLTRWWCMSSVSCTTARTVVADAFLSACLPACTQGLPPCVAYLLLRETQIGQRKGFDAETV